MDQCSLSDIDKVEVGEHVINGLGILILVQRDVDELTKCPDNAELHLVNVTISYEKIPRYRIGDIIPFRSEKS